MRRGNFFVGRVGVDATTATSNRRHSLDLSPSVSLSDLYRVEAGRVVVLAILHAARGDAAWRERK